MSHSLLIHKLAQLGHGYLAGLVSDFAEGVLQAIVEKRFRALIDLDDAIELITPRFHVLLYPDLTITVLARTDHIDREKDEEEKWWFDLSNAKIDARLNKEPKRYLVYVGSDFTDRIEHTGSTISADNSTSHHIDLPKFLVNDDVGGREYSWAPLDLGWSEVPRYFELSQVLNYLDEEVVHVRSPLTATEITADSELATMIFEVDDTECPPRSNS